MKIKKGFVLREIAGECVVVPVNSDLNFDGMITLNETAKTLWLALEKGADEDALVAALLDEYEVDEATARVGVAKFVETLKSNGFLE